MDFKEILKKLWFIGVLAIAFVTFIVVYIVDDVKNAPILVKRLQNDGKDVVYTIDDNIYYYAEDLFDALYNNNDAGVNAALAAYHQEVINQAIETTDDLKTRAKTWATYLLQNNDEATILNSIKPSGYNSIDDLETYCLNNLKYNQFITGYYLDNYDELIKPVIEVENPRKIYHILIKVADVETIENTDEETGNKLTNTYIPHPTEEETQKLNDVLEALKTKSFQEVAREYSEDTGTAVQDGYLGVVCNFNSKNYVDTFSEAAMNMEIGTTTDPIVTNYGYHILMSEEADKEELVQDNGFYSAIQDKYVNKDLFLLMDKGKEIGLNIVNEDINKFLDNYIEATQNLGEDEENTDENPEENVDEETSDDTGSEE